MTNSVFKTLLYGVCLTATAPVFAQTGPLTTALNAQLSVSGEMSIHKFQLLLQDGFKSVIVNRPDQEIGNLVSVNQLRNIAEELHVGVIYQPISSGKVSNTDIIEFAKYYNELPKPILMVCRSGSRSSLLFNQAKSQGLLNE